MSDPEHSSEQWRQSVQDMIVFCERILDHTSGIDKATLVDTRLTYDAVLWNIVLLREAASNVPDQVRDEDREVMWSDIVGTRHQIIHRYWRIDFDIVWDIIQSDVPDLLPRLRNMLESR